MFRKCSFNKLYLFKRFLRVVYEILRKSLFPQIKLKSLYYRVAYLQRNKKATLLMEMALKDDSIYCCRLQT